MEPKASQMPDYTIAPPAQAVFKTSVISQIFIEDVTCARPFQALIYVRRDKSFGLAEFIYQEETGVRKLCNMLCELQHTLHIL